MTAPGLASARSGQAVAGFPFADVALARRLERAEAVSNACFVEARGRRFPSSGACWIEVAGAYAMFDGIASPATQTFGLGMSQPATAGDLDRLEAFFQLEIGRVSAQTAGLHLFVAELDGAAIAAGAMHLRDGIAHLAGASTVPDGRRRGAQLALLEYRLQYAVAHGCDLALMGAAPGSGSQRNAERNGFRIAYTRLKWKR